MSDSDGECKERFHNARPPILRESMGTALEQYVVSELDEDKKNMSPIVATFYVPLLLMKSN